MVRKYDPAGNLITELGRQRRSRWLDDGERGPSARSPGLAVGSDGKLYVGVLDIFNGEDELFEFNEDGTFDVGARARWRDPPVGITVDGVGNVFYVSYGEEV